MQAPGQETILAMYDAERLAPANFVAITLHPREDPRLAAETSLQYKAEPLSGPGSLELSQSSMPAIPWDEGQTSEYMGSVDSKPLELYGEALLGLVALNASSSKEQDDSDQPEESSLEEEDSPDADIGAESDSEQSNDIQKQDKDKAFD